MEHNCIKLALSNCSKSFGQEEKSNRKTSHETQDMTRVCIQFNLNIYINRLLKVNENVVAKIVSKMKEREKQIKLKITKQ